MVAVAKASSGVGKAVAAAKGARVGSVKSKVALRKKVHFYRPKTKTGGFMEKRYAVTLPRARGNGPDNSKVVKKPLTTESAMKKIEDHNTLVFLIDPRANKTQIKAAVSKVREREGGRGVGVMRLRLTVATALSSPRPIAAARSHPPVLCPLQLYDIKVLKVNTLIRPDGIKKAYVKLTADYDALDVANRIGII